jgi:hypothetical protein
MNMIINPWLSDHHTQTSELILSNCILFSLSLFILSIHTLHLIQQFSITNLTLSLNNEKTIANKLKFILFCYLIIECDMLAKSCLLSLYLIFQMIEEKALNKS